MAQALGHTYIGIVRCYGFKRNSTDIVQQNDTLLVKSEWIQHPGEKNSPELHNGTLVELNIPLFRDVLEQALKVYQI